MELSQVTLGAVLPEEEARFRALMGTHHYLGGGAEGGGDAVVWRGVAWRVGGAGVVFGGGAEVAIPLLDQLGDLAGKTVTADALLTQTAIASYLRKHDAHYMFVAKGNRNNLGARIAAAHEESE